MHISLAGRSAIVTGGSKGIGLAVASEFAASGAEVVIVARGLEALTAAVDGIRAKAQARVTGVQGDVGKADDVRRVYDEAMSALGKVDILVNNAGTSRNTPFIALTDELLQGDLEQKLFAAVRLTRLVWPQMVERRWGRIINVLNIGAKTPRPGSAPTSISRAAGMALTKVLAGEGAPHNVLVNAMLVGLIESNQHVERAARTGVGIDDYLRSTSTDIPLGRYGKPEEFANLACLLASDAGSYITGTAINVDGGRSPAV
jgi:NAD(P)-dependent dehydrogenase (short-subunit alcohol dehydrogenase family)